MTPTFIHPMTKIKHFVFVAEVAGLAVILVTLVVDVIVMEVTAVVPLDVDSLTALFTK